MEPEQNPAFVQVPVPADLVEDVYALITARRAGKQGDAASAEAEPTWDEKRLRQLAGHSNEQLQKVLTYVAEHSPEWVPARDAMAAAGREMGKGAGGFFSRLNRSSQHRYGLPLPIERGYRPDLQYQMPKDTARVYLKVRAEVAGRDGT